MSDIFHEVEEDIRRERLEKLWKQYGDYIIALAAAVILGVVAFKLWQNYEARQSAKASAAYEAALDLAQNGDSTKAAAALATLAKSAPGGYATVAKLARAGTLLVANDRSDALALYKSIAAGDSTALGGAARIRAGWIMAQSDPKSAVETWLAPLTDPTSPWQYLAREIIAWCDFRDGHLKQAGAEYAALAAQPDAPDGVRQRASAMAALVKAGGSADYGSVPQPATPQPATPKADTASIPAMSAAGQKSASPK